MPAARLSGQRFGPVPRRPFEAVDVGSSGRACLPAEKTAGKFPYFSRKHWKPALQEVLCLPGGIDSKKRQISNKFNEFPYSSSIRKRQAAGRAPEPRAHDVKFPPMDVPAAPVAHFFSAAARVTREPVSPGHTVRTQDLYDARRV